MALTDLNVALRLSTREFNRELGRAESALRAASERLSGIGNTLSLAITAPLAGIGGAAIVAAGEFEKLRLGLEATMTDAGYSIAQARQELEQLREVAKAPGIDFEQAVKGSLRLQSVGLSAEQARETIAQFANGVAAAGGTAENLNSVTTQLSQIIGKGKILNEDLVILKENMPSVSRALTNAFGTATAEGLRDLNISAEELVVTLTKELAKAPRVAGGIANSIQNARVAVVEAGAKIGDALNRAFNITGALDRFSAFIVRIADAFADLSPETQRAIFAVGAFALALGPAIRVGGLLVNTFFNIQLAMASFVRFANAQLIQAIGGATGGIRGLITAFRALDLATKATVIGAAVGVFLALGAAVAVYASASDEAAQNQKALTEVQNAASSAIGPQIAKVNQLAKAVQDETATEEDRLAALKQLQAVSPEYFGSLDLEKAKTDQLTTAVGKYVEEISRAARAKAAFEKLSEQETRLIDLQFELNQATADYQKISKNITAGLAGQGAERRIQALKNEIASVESRRDAYAKLVGENGGIVKAINEVTEATSKLPKEPIEPTIKPKIDPNDFADLDADIEQLLEQNEYTIRLKAAYELPKLPQLEGANLGNTQFGVAIQGVESIQQTSLSVEQLSAGIRGLSIAGKEAANIVAAGFVQQAEAAALYKQQLDAIAQGTGILIQQTDEGFKANINTAQIFADAISGIGNAIAGALENGELSFKSFAQAAISAIADVIGQLIKQFVATQIANAAKNPAIAALGPAGIPIAAAAGALASAAFKRVVGAAKFADGGIVYGPTLGLVGEYPGASNNPEVIAPLSKLRSLISPADEMTLQTRISGNDLVVLVERSQKQRNRTR